mmetsp:Transcript_89171/g.241883  ORF Transcript_89171/g.241883 Transcript_89171/m.241883 type:complete len:204 (+) Transcript_89171:575-1186(+)
MVDVLGSVRGEVVLMGVVVVAVSDLMGVDFEAEESEAVDFEAVDFEVVDVEVVGIGPVAFKVVELEAAAFKVVSFESMKFETMENVVDVVVGIVVDENVVFVTTDSRLVIVGADPFATGQPYPVFSWQHHLFFTSDHSISQPLVTSRQSNGTERSDWSAGHPTGGWLLQHQDFFASDHPTLHRASPAVQSNGSVVELRQPSGG